MSGILSSTIPFGSQQFGLGPQPAAKSGGASPVLIALVVILALVVIYSAWKSWRMAVPDCAGADLTKQQAAACKQATATCAKGGSAKAGCLNAVARCMPLSAAKDGHATFAQMSACADAVAKVDPAFVATLASNAAAQAGVTACIPARFTAAQIAAHQATVNGGVKLAATLIPYAMKVASKLPACSAAADGTPGMPSIAPNGIAAQAINQYVAQAAGALQDPMNAQKLQQLARQLQSMSGGAPGASGIIPPGTIHD